MSKKKHNKKHHHYYESDYDYGYGKKDKKKKKDIYEKPELKCVKPSLDKKEAKESRKILQQPVEIPKAFKKNRERCNHAWKTMSVDEFIAMTPNYAAYTPMLDSMVRVFGKDNLQICKSCYDVLVDLNKVDVNKVQTSLVTLYAAANAALANRRLKKDEIETIAKTRDSLVCDWALVIETLRKIEDEGSQNCSDDECDSKSNGVKNLNRISNDMISGCGSTTY